MQRDGGVILLFDGEKSIRESRAMRTVSEV